MVINAGVWSDIESTRFVYEGWNVIEEYNTPGTGETLAQLRVWGTDLSGSWQGAGGVGGLLVTEEVGAGATTTQYHFHYDGNGNVTELTDATGAIAGSYRYDVFGNLRNTPTGYGADNRYRFSTKPLDDEVSDTPLYYYGYRYYDPVTGRWPSRDPIEEEGGVNLYGFVGNDGLNTWDLLGLEEGVDKKGKCCCVGEP